MRSGRGANKILPISAVRDDVAALEKPVWLRVRAPSSTAGENRVRQTLRTFGLSTVCREANCPNIAECFAGGTAAFLILGDVCTRRCAFCDLAHGTPQPPDIDEPIRLAEATSALQLKYVVVTSPDRDDLKDGGAEQFAAVISELRKRAIEVEILVPDFRKMSKTALDILCRCPPDVFNHNIETVPSLYRIARPGASYEHSLCLLKEFKERCPQVPTKSGLMLGLGETDEEVLQVLEDLLSHGVERVTIGQYLAPSKSHLPVRRYVSPEDFSQWEQKARAMGFKTAHAGVFVRSSYHAEQDSCKTV